MGKREDRRVELPLRLSNAAVQLFTAHGFEAVRAEDIATAAGVSVRTFHRYFPTKQDAVLPALDALWDEFLASLTLASTSVPIEDAIAEIFLRTRSSALTGRQLALFKAMADSPHLEAVRLRMYARFEARMRATLTVIFDSAPDDPEVALFAATLTAVARLVTDSTLDGRESPEKVARDLFGAALRLAPRRSGVAQRSP
ncbi:TetR family transcriptional regulator [Agromyces sp. GXS1127]|uniref:TetR family transcriptional regulator n=1 Tax=Agromyces sp. GXS1127 TaxID=3424181 RepID=UPI003D310CB5